jgi:uncharacterized membrane protein
MAPDSQAYTAAAGPANKRSYRIDSIDFLRGLVMVIMALDHVRDFFTDVRYEPLDLSQTDSALFLTRCITHFCAPIFILLSGDSAGMMAERKSKAELSRFLVSRGLWLIVVEVFLVSFGWQFSVGPGFAVGLQVIWAIGVSMIVLAGLVWLPVWAIAAFGGVLVLGHNILDYGLFPPSDWIKPAPFWHGLHSQGVTLVMGFQTLLMYPLVPWVGLMPLGYLLARLYRLDEEKRRRALLTMGFAAVGLFILVRGVNAYGNPSPWSSQASPGMTVLSFLNTTKYPPSLSFLLMTLGPGLLLLAVAEGWRGRFKNWMVVFGRVPFFYYLVHIYLAHLLALAAAEWQGFGWQALARPFWMLPEGYGFSLPVVWVIWLAVVIMLYPACKWFANVKARRKDWWLSYL